MKDKSNRNKIKLYSRSSTFYNSRDSCSMELSFRYAIIKNSYMEFFCEQYAFHVFSMRVATVIGHTPPGVGVIARIVSFKSSKSVSPLATPSINVFPTSITTDSEWSISRVRSHGEPAATITISAFFVFSERLLVELLQVMTVAPALIIMRAIGLPTILDRPMITTSFPATSI